MNSLRSLKTDQPNFQVPLSDNFDKIGHLNSKIFQENKHLASFYKEIDKKIEKVNES